MASKSHAVNLLDIENDDSEINLQFQDFDEPSTKSSRDEFSKNQAVYFNSFSESLDDDQEQKLLGEDGESKPKSVHSFWTFEYYQQYFDVDSKQVGDRIIWSMVPKPGVNFLQSYIRPNPDIYGPFWICITLILTTAVAGNLSNYLQTSGAYRWRYDFHKVTLATSSIFTYAWLAPLLIWGVLRWRGSKANISLLELICLYGYSLAVFVPVSLLWMIPLRWLQWCLGIVASVLSGSVLVRTIQPAVSHEAKKVAYGLAVLILLLHAALALGFMLYFFYPPNSTVPYSKESGTANNTQQFVEANNDLDKSQVKVGESKGSGEDEKQERSNNAANGSENLNIKNVKNSAAIKHDLSKLDDKNDKKEEVMKREDSETLAKVKVNSVPKAMSLHQEDKDTKKTDHSVSAKKESKESVGNKKEIHTGKITSNKTQVENVSKNIVDKKNIKSIILDSITS